MTIRILELRLIGMSPFRELSHNRPKNGRYCSLGIVPGVTRL